MDFQDCFISDLDRALPLELDRLSFCVIGFGRNGAVTLYSAAESRMAGLSPDKVIGRHIFSVVAPCMNNFLVAQRFEDEPELDSTIDFVLTFRMRPTPVKLRMLQSVDAVERFLLIQRT